MSTRFDNKKQEEILKRDGEGRLRTSRERREAILDDFEASAMSGVGYARAHGIKYPTFANWIQKRRRERGDYGKAEPPAKTPGVELALAEVVVKTHRHLETGRAAMACALNCPAVRSCLWTMPAKPHWRQNWSVW